MNMNITNLTDEEASQLTRFLKAIAPNAVIAGQEKKRSQTTILEKIMAYTSGSNYGIKFADIYTNGAGDGRLFIPLEKMTGKTEIDVLEFSSRCDYEGKVWKSQQVSNFTKL